MKQLEFTKMEELQGGYDPFVCAITFALLISSNSFIEIQYYTSQYNALCTN